MRERLQEGIVALPTLRATPARRLGSRRGRGAMGEATVRPRGLRIPWAAPLVLILIVPIPAEAFELSGDVSLGGSRLVVPFRGSRSLPI